MASVCSCFLMTILEKSSLHEEIREVDHHENMVILVDGASWSINVDTGEWAKSTALGALASGTREAAIVGGLKQGYKQREAWRGGMAKPHAFASYDESWCTIPHNLCNLVITELDGTEKLVDEIEEEEDGATGVLDPRDVPGSVLLEITNFAILDFDLLDLADQLTPVEVDTELLVVVDIISRNILSSS
ncbi:hypothetical protein Tco_1321166 [Tanacetum coccineum]